MTLLFLKKEALFLFLCVGTALSTQAQSLANYSSALNTGIPYSSIASSGNAIASWRNVGTLTQDDNRSDFINIGFDFWYDGTRYNQFCVSTNGFIDFSTSTSDGGSQANAFSYDNSSFSASFVNSSTRPAIAPFYDDLTTQGGVNALGTSIKYQLSGSAPSRTLTVEWINMAVYNNVSPSLNFQVVLLESTGDIQVNYGTMNSGSHTFSYSMGLNGPTINLFPTAAQLKMLQSVNGNSFSNNAQHNLSAMPSANTRYVFSPPLPANPSGALTFSGISQTGMTLNWTNWASNEIGYVIYNSIDGINFDFVSQTAANASSEAVTGLNAGTLYYWKVYAVTEGRLSNALSGNQATGAAGNKISNTSGNWSNASIWTPNGVPGPGDNVTISNGHVVSINSDASCNALTVGNGAATTLRFTTNTARSVIINTDLIINSAASFNVATNSNTTHDLTIRGNITNNGTLDFASDASSLCNTIFNANGNRTISGTGGTTRFNLMTVDLGSSANNLLTVSSSNFSAAAGFLTLNNGTFSLATTNNVNITPFNGSTTLPQTAALSINSANAVVNSNADVTLAGNITITNGTLNIGNAANEDLLFLGGSLTIAGGVTNIAGKLYTSGINNVCNFNMSSGALNVPVYGSTSTTDAPFQVTSAGSQFNVSGGVITLVREGGGGSQNLGFINSGGVLGAITGGTFQVGSPATPGGQIMQLNSEMPIHQLLVNSTNATARLSVNTLTVTADVKINSGTLDANNVGLKVGGNWTNSGNFIPGTGEVTFASNSSQTIFKSGGETFHHLNFTGTGTKLLGAPLTANGNFLLETGATVDISSSNFSVTLKGNFTNNGTLMTRSGLIFLNGSSQQSLGGSSITNFNDLTLNNPGGALMTAPQNLIGTLSLNNGTFNTNSQVLTMVSTATATARVGQITGSGNIIGDVTVQRFVPGGYTGWALVGAPIVSPLTFNDLDDDLYIACPNCPDGPSGYFVSIVSYDETPSGNYDSAPSYVSMSSINDAINTNKGYWVYMGNGQFTTTDIVFDLSGSLRKFNYTLPLNYTNNGSVVDDGWNLIANPYPSAISWSSLKGSTANVDNAIYVYNADLNGGTGGFASYVNGVSSPAVNAGGIGDVIPMSQGFYVHSTGATALQAAEANKVTANPAFLRPVSGPNPLIRLTLGNGFTTNDEVVLYTEAGANNTFDVGFDSYKMRGQDPYAPYLAIDNGINDLQISGVAPVSGTYTTSLKSLTGYAGTYTISASEISNVPHGVCISLYDRFTAITTDLRSFDYVFNLEDTTTVSRFILSITNNSLSISSLVSQPTCLQPMAGSVTVSGTNAGPWNYYWQLNGQIIKTSLNKSTADTLMNLVSGNVELEVSTVGQCESNQSSYVLNAQLPVSAQFSVPASVDFNPVTFINLSVNSAGSFWDFGDAVGTSQSENPVYTYDQPGLYTVMLISTSSTGCKDTAYKSVSVADLSTGLLTNAFTRQGVVVKTLEPNYYQIEPLKLSDGTFIFKLSDASGKTVRDFGTQARGAWQLMVDLRSLPKGMYYLECRGGDADQVMKLPVN